MTAGTQATAMQRARREAEAIAKIEHQNVVTVHDQVETDNQVWIVMKLLEARSLGDLLSRDGVLAVPRAANIGLQVLQGLQGGPRGVGRPPRCEARQRPRPGRRPRDPGRLRHRHLRGRGPGDPDRQRHRHPLLPGPRTLRPRIPRPHARLRPVGARRHAVRGGRGPRAATPGRRCGRSRRTSGSPPTPPSGTPVPSHPSSRGCWSPIPGSGWTRPRRRRCSGGARRPASPNAGAAGAATHPPTAVSTPNPSTPPTPALRPAVPAQAPAVPAPATASAPRPPTAGKRR